MRPTRSLPIRQRAAARDAPSPIAVLGSPLRDGSRGGCGARPALLPRLLLFLLLLRAPVRPSRSAHGKRPPPRAAARSPARPRRPSRAAAPPHSGGAGWGSRAAARRLERPGRARAGCACDWPAILPGLAREGSRRDEARWTAERRPPRSRPPGLRLGSPPHGSAGPPERRALLGRASLSGGDSPSVLCTLSAGVWRRPDLLTTQTHSSLQARAEPIAMASAVTAPEALPLLDERSFAGSQPSFLSKGCPHGVTRVPLLSTREGL